MDQTNASQQESDATSPALERAQKALEAAQAARTGEADRLAAARLELEEIGKQLKATHPDAKEFKTLLAARATCRDRLEVLELRLAAAQVAVNEAEEAHAAALDVHNRARLKTLDAAIAAEEEAILEWFSREVVFPLAERTQKFEAMQEEARVLDLALGKRAGRGPAVPLTGIRRVRWLLRDRDPFEAAAAFRRSSREARERQARIAAEVQKSYTEAVELHARLAAEEAQRQRARERMRENGGQL